MERNDPVVLIPYIEIEGGCAEVWIGRDISGDNPLTKALSYLSRFAGTNDPTDIREHCRIWGADRILLPDDDTPVCWTAYAIDEVLAGRLVESV